MEFPEEIYYMPDGEPAPSWLLPDPGRKLIVERAFLLGYRMALESVDRSV